ncbi:GNAT family N-acetyltransferase [Pollutibacter soli]|uniref:GNAT family N-acetyltransferase n=1 Tax=Pollutibacter soli TaxID=3034157 RepID=UPI003013ECB1
MNEIEIEKVRLSDIGELQNISIKTFSDTFSAANTRENMKKYIDENFSFKKLTEELNDENAEFYFARLDGVPVGYLKLNYGKSQTEMKMENALEIERIYVVSEYHGKGIAQFLYNKAMERGRDKNADYIWLGVWEENHRAIRFYKKNDFVEFDKHIFRLGNDEQTDLMMKLQLKENTKG